MQADAAIFDLNELHGGASDDEIDDMLTGGAGGGQVDTYPTGRGDRRGDGCRGWRRHHE